MPQTFVVTSSDGAWIAPIVRSCSFASARIAAGSWLAGSFVTMTSTPEYPVSATMRKVAARGRAKNAADEKSSRVVGTTDIVGMRAPTGGRLEARMLRAMWVFPLVAAAVAAAVRRARGRRSTEPAGARTSSRGRVALAMYAVASIAVGARRGRGLDAR